MTNHASTPFLHALPDVQRRTAHESVLATLRHAILTGQLAGGTRLVQADIAAQLGVSNTPVREAMRQLASEGMIRFDSYRGAVVHTPTVQEVLEVYEVRLLLEPVAVRKAATRIEVKQLDEAARLHVAMRSTRDIAEWVAHNLAFHRVILDAAGSSHMASILSGLEHTATAHVALSLKADPRRMARGNREHAQILKALRRKDADMAAQLVTEHLESTVRAVESAATVAPSQKAAQA